MLISYRPIFFVSKEKMKVGILGNDLPKWFNVKNEKKSEKNVKPYEKCVMWKMWNVKKMWKKFEIKCDKWWSVKFCERI